MLPSISMQDVAKDGEGDALARSRAAYMRAEQAMNAGAMQDSRASAELTLQLLSALPEQTSAAGSVHVLFAETLLLLSAIYGAVCAYDEAERFLVTCAGYVADHLGSSHIGLAVIAYNRAVLVLEEECSVRDGRSPAGGRCTSPTTEEGRTMTRIRYARDVLLGEARRRLENTQDVQRLLLADVWHSHGVCNYLVGDYVTALEDFARSLSVRLRYGDTTGVTELKLALTLEHMAHLYRLMPDHKLRALELLGRVAQTRERWLGTRHSLTVLARLAHGVLAAQLQRYKVARHALRRAEKGARALYADGDSRLRHIVLNLRRVEQHL